MLPPLMFSTEEIEALVLGSRWVADRGDTRLQEGARNALAKIAAVLPDDLRASVDSTALLVGPASERKPDSVDLGQIRQAIRTERVTVIHYRDQQEAETKRTVWPFALGYFDHVRILAAWCELRQGFRHFRTDRILGLDVGDRRYPKRRQALLKQWRETVKTHRRE
jgi:predicted DNA-binding transcriptional regulator YafY